MYFLRLARYIWSSGISWVTLKPGSRPRRVVKSIFLKVNGKIEAAQHGLPILARDITVFREVAENNAFYFSGENDEGIFEEFKYWLKMFKEKQHQDSTRMKWMTWVDSADQLMKVLIEK